MDIYYNLNDIKNTPCVLALGDFDGVHLGHRQLLKALESASKKYSCSSGVYTFTVNSKLCLGASTVSLLTTDDEKSRIFDECGVDFALYDDFMAVKDYSPEEFCDYLIQNAKPVAVVCGENFTFGRYAKAGSGDLKRLMEARGVECIVVSNFSLENIGVSSTQIRKYITDGYPEKAERLLGYRYFIKGEVVHGAALGRTLGFPTINQLCYGGKTVPCFGVYCTVCEIDGKSYAGVTNVGIKPTVSSESDDAHVVFETNVIDYSGDLYGKTVKVEFCHMLRKEKKFSSLEELAENVLLNIKQTREYFERCVFGDEK